MPGRSLRGGSKDRLGKTVCLTKAQRQDRAVAEKDPVQVDAQDGPPLGEAEILRRFREFSRVGSPDAR